MSSAIPRLGDKRDAKPLPHNLLIIYLKYGPGGEKVINGIDRMPANPACAVMWAVSEIPRVFGGLGSTILTTSKGVMSGREAKKQNIGGELLCTVW